MKYDKALIDIVKKREFQTFWNCLDYLLMAGYSPIDAFGISLQEFGESRIYSDVAYIRLQPRVQISRLETGYSHLTSNGEMTMFVGLIDSTNIHLSGLYTTYRKWLIEGRFPFNAEIESTCSLITINGLTPFIMDYLLSVSNLHFGLEIFKILRVDPLTESIRRHDDRQNRYIGGMGEFINPNNR